MFILMCGKDIVGKKDKKAREKGVWVGFFTAETEHAVLFPSSSFELLRAHKPKLPTAKRIFFPFC